MMQDILSNIDIYSPLIIGILILAGFLVGFINTLAGSGTIISYSLFMALGLPVSMSNGTIRLGVIMQTLIASFVFKKNAILDIKKGLILGIPIVIGSILGANIAVRIQNDVFEWIVSGVMVLMLFFLFTKPKRWIEGRSHKAKVLPIYLQIPIFLLIGVYGGFIHIGVGIFLLAGFVLFSGYDLLRANALKIFVVFLYSPFALAVYIYNDQVHYPIALISSIGNVIGGLLASKMAVKKGSKFIHWFLTLIVILFLGKTLGLFNVFLAN